MTINISPKTALCAVVGGLGLWFGLKLVSYVMAFAALVN